MIQMAISRSQEFEADRTGAALLGTGEPWPEPSRSWRPTPAASRWTSTQPRPATSSSTRSPAARSSFGNLRRHPPEHRRAGSPPPRRLRSPSASSPARRRAGDLPAAGPSAPRSSTSPHGPGACSSRISIVPTPCRMAAKSTWANGASSAPPGWLSTAGHHRLLRIGHLHGHLEALTELGRRQGYMIPATQPEIGAGGDCTAMNSSRPRRCRAGRSGVTCRRGWR